MFDATVLTRIREYIGAELAPRDRVFKQSLRAEINRITPTQGALSGAAAHACMELGRAELQVRAALIWNAIKRSYASLVGRDTPTVLEDLQQQVAEYLTEEARKVANIASESWRANPQLFPLVRDSIDIECRNQLRERYSVEVKFYVDDLKRPVSADSTAPALTFHGPVGAVHTGAHATSQITLNTGESEQLIKVLELFRSSVQANTEMSSEQRTNSLDLVSDLILAVKQEKPNVAKVTGLLNGLAQTVQTVASIQGAWGTVKSLAIAIGVWFTNL